MPRTYTSGGGGGTSGAQIAATTVGDGVNTKFTFNHGLAASSDLLTYVREATGKLREVLVDVTTDSATAVTVHFSVIPPVNSYRVIVAGL